MLPVPSARSTRFPVAPGEGKDSAASFVVLQESRVHPFESLHWKSALHGAQFGIGVLEHVPAASGALSVGLHAGPLSVPFSAGVVESPAVAPPFSSISPQ